MTLISPGDCTLQCVMWRWNHDSSSSSSSSSKKSLYTAVEEKWQPGPVQLVQSQGMLFTTKHVIYQVKVHLTWLGQGPPIMWLSQLP